MRRLIFYTIIIILAVAAGLWLMRDPGYVMLAYGTWSIETSLWFLIIVILLALIIIWMILRLLSGAWFTPVRFGRWHKGRRSIKAHSLTSDGVLALHAGEWRVAEALLIKGVKSSAVPVINYLSAARAAQEQLAYDRRDRYLTAALKVDKQEHVAIELTRAKLQLEHHQLPEAHLTLKQLKEKYEKHDYVLKLIFEYQILAHNWQRQLAIIPELRKRKIVDEERLEHQAYLSMKHVLNDANIRLQDIEEIWGQLSKKLRGNLRIQKAYIQRLIDFHAHEKAAKLIVASLKQAWNEDLVSLFAQVRLTDPAHQLDIIDGWLKKHESTACLFVTTGAVALHAKAWAIAKTYAEKALRLEKTPAAYLVLAVAAENLGEDALMASALKQGLSLQCEAQLGLVETSFAQDGGVY